MGMYWSEPATMCGTWSVLRRRRTRRVAWWAARRANARTAEHNPRWRDHPAPLAAGAIDLFGVKEGISYVSTGGGAFLEFLEGRTLPAVAALQARAAG